MKQFGNSTYGGFNDSIKKVTQSGIEQIEEAYEIDFIDSEYKEPKQSERQTNYDLGSVVTKRLNASGARSKELSNIREKEPLKSPLKNQDDGGKFHKINRPPKLQLNNPMDKQANLTGVSMFEVTNDEMEYNDNETHGSLDLQNSGRRSALAKLGKGYQAPQETKQEIEEGEGGDTTHGQHETEHEDTIDEQDVQLATNIQKNSPFMSTLKFSSLPSFQSQNHDESPSTSILKKPRYKSKVDKKLTIQQVLNGANNQVILEQSLPQILSNPKSRIDDLYQEPNRQKFLSIDLQNRQAPPILSSSRISMFSGVQQDGQPMNQTLDSNASTLQSIQSNMSLIKKYSPAIGKDQFSLKIQSSRTLDDREHSDLFDILEKVDQLVRQKKKIDQQQSLVKSGIEKASKSGQNADKQMKQKKKSVSPDGESFAQAERDMILRQKKEAQQRAQTDRKIFEALKIPFQENQTIQLKSFGGKDFRSKSTIRPQKSKPHTEMISTGRSKMNLSQMRQNTTVNSAYYIQSQWDEINTMAQRKRSIVHELAEQQKQTHCQRPKYTTIQGSPPEKDIYSNSDIIKSMKATKKISRVSPSILRGIEENEEYVTKGQNRRTMTDHEAYEKLQKLFVDRPRRPVQIYDPNQLKGEAHNGFMAKTLQRAKDKQSKTTKKETKPEFQVFGEDHIHVSEAELLRERLNKMPHERIMKVKKDLYDLLLLHLTHKNVKENNVVKLGEDTEKAQKDVMNLIGEEFARILRANKAEHQDLELNQLEIKRQDILTLFGRMDLSLSQEAKETMDERIQMSKQSLSSIRKINTEKLNTDNNYLIKALEDLPERELIRLVEILLEERKNEINLGKKRQLKERMNESKKTLEQSTSGLGYILTHPSQMSIAQAKLEKQGEPNPLKFKINSFQNTIDLKKKKEAESQQFEVKNPMEALLGPSGIFKGLGRNGSNTSIQHINNPEFEMPQDYVNEMNEMNVSFSIPGKDKKHDRKRPQKIAVGNNNKQPFQKPFMGVSVSRPSIFAENESAFQLGKAPIIEQQIEAEARVKIIIEDTQYTYSPSRIDEYNQQQYQFDDTYQREYSTILCIPEESKEQEYSFDIEKQQQTKNTDALRAVYQQIIERKSRFAPVFSGNLGHNIYDNSEYMLEMFRTLPPSPNVKSNISIQRTQADPFEIDEFFKLEKNQNIQQAIQKQSNLSQEQRNYYEKVSQMFKANHDTKVELQRQRQDSKGPLNFKHIFASQVSTGKLAAGTQQQHIPPGALHNIDLKRAARQYQNGLYYLMSVLDHKILDLQGVEPAQQNKGLSMKQLKMDQKASKNSISKYKRRATMLVDSPFQKIDHFNQAHEDSENLVPALISKISFTKGSKPSSRAYFGCQFARGKFFVIGGTAQRPMNDLRSFNLATSAWTREDKQETKSKNNEGRFDSALSYIEQDKTELQGGIPAVSRLSPRFQSALCIYMDKYLVVFGGVGLYVNNNVQRQTFNDLFFWDITAKDKGGTQSGEWIDMSIAAKDSKVKQSIMKEAQFDKDWKIGHTMHSGKHIKEKKADIADFEVPQKRCQHVMGVYGGCLVINGGFNIQENRVLDDFSLFDIALGMWVKFKQPKKDKKICQIGPRYQHSLTSVQDPNVDLKKRNTRVMWIQDANSIIAQDPEDTMIKNNKKRAFQKSGMFVFGGLNGSHQPKNDLYLVNPHYERNIKYLTSEKANYKKSINATICFSVRKLNPQGRPPAPRYAHAASFVSKYLVIHGGRNDDFYESMKNIALNDLNLYDINANTWCTVAIFGEVPQSRWGHIICGENSPSQDYKKTKLIIFGGCNLDSFFDTSIYKISIDTDEFIKAHEENELAIAELHAQGQYLLGAEKSKDDPQEEQDEEQ